MRICVYCGSSPGNHPIYIEAAQSLGDAILQRGYELVYGGAEVGLMGAIADRVLAAGGKVTGIIPKTFADKISHHGLTQLHVVDSMHARKEMMFSLSDAFVALPGGFGTIEEITEMLTWAQLGFHQKPCGLLNINKYYDPIIAFLETAEKEGFIKSVHRNMLLFASNPDELFSKFENYDSPKKPKWVK